jgi:hypothetical protein
MDLQSKGLWLSIITVLGVVIGGFQYMQSTTAASQQDSTQKTQIAILQNQLVVQGSQLSVNEQQLTVQKEIASIQQKSPEPKDETRIVSLEKTATALETAQIAVRQGESSAAYALPGVPLREHREVNIGSGVFSSATFSDGMAPYDSNWLWTNNHHNIQRIRPEENPDGCGYAQYDASVIWVGTAAAAKVTVNGTEIGAISTITNRQKHGYVVNAELKLNDKICITPVPAGGFHLIFGPDVYYHHDSYCYRGGC